MIIFTLTQCYNYSIRLAYFTKQSHLCSMMSEQLIELSLVEIELMSKTLLHCMTPIITHTNWDNQCNFKDPKVVYSRSFEMNRQQTHMTSSFYVRWMRSLYTRIPSLPPSKRSKFTSRVTSSIKKGFSYITMETVLMYIDWYGQQLSLRKDMEFIFLLIIMFLQCTHSKEKKQYLHNKITV